ncbi:MAG: hypothetical protein HY788_00785 [Deltaproteobacteria bacterium]|nr:hypothetical protein [Deltaproteobacteria bacterium]
MSEAEEKTEGPGPRSDAKPDEVRASSSPPKTGATAEMPAENAGKGSEAETAEEPAPQPPASELELLLEEYPLREPGKDPRWALRTVWIWIGFALLSLAFILTLLILGAIHD